jgi:hypothetical protein
MSVSSQIGHTRLPRARVTLIFCRTLTLRHAHIEKHGEQILREMELLDFVFAFRIIFLLQHDASVVHC